MNRAKELISAYGVNCALWGGNKTETNEEAALASGEQLLAYILSFTERLSTIENCLRSATHEVLFDPQGSKHVMAIPADDYRRILELLKEETA